MGKNRLPQATLQTVVFYFPMGWFVRLKTFPQPPLKQNLKFSSVSPTAVENLDLLIFWLKENCFWMEISPIERNQNLC